MPMCPPHAREPLPPGAVAPGRRLTEPRLSRLRGLGFPDRITKLSSKTLARPKRLYGMCLALKPRRTELPVPRLFRKEGDLPKHLQPVDISEMLTRRSEHGDRPDVEESRQHRTASA